MFYHILDDSIVEPKFEILQDTKEFTRVKLKRSNQIVKIPKVISCQIAYLLGVVAGDGHLSVRQRKISRFPCTKLLIFNNSKDFILYLEIMLKKTFSMKSKVYKKSYNNCFVLEVNNKLVWLFFSKNLGIQNKKYDLRVPNLVQNKELFKFFLAGIIDTDGYFDKSNKVYGLTLGGSHFNFLLQIQKLCMKFYEIKMIGPYKGIIKQNNKTYFRCELYTSAYFTKKFQEIIPLIKKKWAWQDSNLRPNPRFPKLASAKL